MVFGQRPGLLDGKAVLMNKQLVLSIVIPCFNAEKFIGKCLDSILQSEFQDYEVVVVDDNSKDKSPKILKNYERLPQIYVIYLDQNQGPAKARNLGVKNSSGKYIIFLDADTEIENGCLETVVDKLESNSKVGALQTKLIKGRSQKIDAAGHFLSFSGFPYEIGVVEDESKHNKETVIFGARSAGMAVRKDLFKEIGGFDEDYFIYGEETDLSWRVWLAGSEIRYFPQAKVYHFQKSTLNEQTRYRIFYEGAKNNTSNILKNAPLGILFWMLPLHLLGWVFISLKLTLQRRHHSAAWIYRGLGWNLVNLDKTIKKRGVTKGFAKKGNRCTEIMFGPLDLKQLLAKGQEWLGTI